MLRRLFSPKPEKNIARSLHADIVKAARHPALYGDDGVADTVEGRFELVVLHGALVILVLRRSKDPQAAAVAQALFDTIFDDFDAAMRELGVGDSAVGKKIRFMAEGFYGRAQRLDEALAAEAESELHEVIARNLLDGEANDPRVGRLALYVKAAYEALSGQGATALAAGESPAFPAA